MTGPSGPSWVRLLLSSQIGRLSPPIPDRKEAIHRAVQIAQDHDIVLIAGKGHETTQVIGSRVEPFSDMAVAQSAIEGRPVDLTR